MSEDFFKVFLVPDTRNNERMRNNPFKVLVEIIDWIINY
jgi:hypothetical protein